MNQSDNESDMSSARSAGTDRSKQLQQHLNATEELFRESLELKNKQIDDLSEQVRNLRGQLRSGTLVDGREVEKLQEQLAVADQEIREKGDRVQSVSDRLITTETLLNNKMKNIPDVYRERFMTLEEELRLKEAQNALLHEKLRISDSLLREKVRSAPEILKEKLRSVESELMDKTDQVNFLQEELRAKQMQIILLTEKVKAATELVKEKRRADAGGYNGTKDAVGMLSVHPQPRGKVETGHKLPHTLPRALTLSELEPKIKDFHVEGTAHTGGVLFAVGNFTAGRMEDCQFQWSKSILGDSFTEIEGATSNSYVPTSGDVGAILRVRCWFERSNGKTSVMKYADSSVASLNPQLTTKIKELLDGGVAEFTVSLRAPPEQCLKGTDSIIACTRQKFKIKAGGQTIHKDSYSSWKISLYPTDSLLFALVSAEKSKSFVFGAQSQEQRDLIAVSFRTFQAQPSTSNRRMSRQNSKHRTGSTPTVPSRENGAWETAK